MQIFKKIGEIILFGGIFFLLFIIAFEQKLQIPTWLKVAGRMHPMFLHFPIVLLLLSFFTLWLPLKNEYDPWLNILRLVAALAAIITATMGLLLSLEEDRTASVLQWHKWFGVSVALLGFIFYHTHSYFTRKKIVGKSFTILASTSIILTGHFGANIAHGDNYLLAPVLNEKKIVPLDKAIVYDDVIKPILQEKCLSCHGESSMKGGLLLGDTAGILKGGKTGPLFIAGKAAVSLLIKRTQLPVEDKHHMPPKSKAQLTDDEGALLYAWIQSGAAMNQKLNLLPADDTFKILAARYLSPLSNSLNTTVYDFTPASESILKSLNSNYRVVEPQGIGSPALAVHFYGIHNYTAKALEDLLQAKQQVTELSLARMPVKDDEMKVVQQMANLEKLNLNYTDITDKGLVQISGLKKLQELSLSGTKVTPEGLRKLLTMPRLSSLVIWDTKMDSNEVTLLRNTFKKVKIETGFIDNGQMIVTLSAPILKKSSGVFDDTTTIEITHPYKGVDIRYALDGSAPDSINGLLYKEPILINQDATLITRAFKKGWRGSDSTQALYIKRSYKPDSVELITPPDPRYKLTKPDLLTDRDLGDMNPDDGKWLGYTKNDALYFLHFNKAATVHSVLINMLKNTDRYIFPPVTIEIWGGIDKQHLKRLGKLTPGMPAKTEPASLFQPKIVFDPIQVQLIEIVAKPLKVIPKWRLEKDKKEQKEKDKEQKEQDKEQKNKQQKEQDKRPKKKDKGLREKDKAGWIFLNEIVVN